MKKKKQLAAALFAVAALWITTGLNPLQLLVSFVAAGALPGVTLSPYIMFGLALAGGTALLYRLSALQVNISHSSVATAKLRSSRTHSTNLKNRRRFTPLTNQKQRNKTKKS